MRARYTSILLFLVAVAVQSSPARGQNPWHRTLEVAQPGWVQVRLDGQAVLAADRGTLELVDPNGDPVAFQLSSKEKNQRAVRILSIAERDEGWWLVLDLGDLPPRHHQLTLVPKELTNVEVVLEASSDRVAWREIHRGELFRLGDDPGLSHQVLAYEKTADRYLRLFWPRSGGAHTGQFPAIESLSVQVETEPLEEKATPLPLRCTGAATSLDCDLEVPSNCREIAVAPNSAGPFGVRVWQAKQGRWVRRLETTGTHDKAVRWPAARGSWRIGLERAVAQRDPTASCWSLNPVLAFQAPKPGLYHLRFTGNAATRPTAELSEATSEATNRREGSPKSWIVAGPEIAESWPPWPNVAVQAAPLPKEPFAAVWPVETTSASPGGTLRLILPAEVLAHSNRRLADLRLAQQGFQIPYVLVELEKPRRLHATRAIPQKSGGTSLVTWRFPTPLPPAMGLRELAIRAPGPFERTVEVSALQDLPGTPQGSREKRQVQWPASPWACHRLDLLPCERRELLSGPLTELQVEVKDDDDVSLPWLELELTESEKALIFAAPQSAAPILLHVGAELDAPGYDLQALRGLLEARPAADATLGRRLPTEKPEKLPPWLLPLVLGLAALLLVYLLVRLVALSSKA